MASGLSPEKLLYGYAKPYDKEFLAIDTIVNNPEDYATELENTVRRQQELHQQLREKKNETQRKYINKRRKEIQFQPNDLVYMRDNTIAQGLEGGTTKMPFKGPFVIEAIGDNGKTAIISDLITNENRCSDLHHLKKATAAMQINLLPTFNQAAATIRKVKHSPQNLHEEESLKLSEPHSCQVVNEEESLNLSEPHSHQVLNEEESSLFLEMFH